MKRALEWRSADSQHAFQEIISTRVCFHRIALELYDVFLTALLVFLK